MTQAMLPALSPVSSLEAYIQAVNAVPLLSAEREVELGRRLREKEDLSAARDLVLSHLRLVVAVTVAVSGICGGIAACGRRDESSCARSRRECRWRVRRASAISSAAPW